MRFLTTMNELTSNASDLFLAIRDAITVNKLAGLRDYWDRDMSYRANGDHLRKIMAPNQTGFTSYWLDSIRKDITTLQNLGLIQTGTRSVGPLGYGDDEEFMLTDKAMELCSGRSRDEVRVIVCRLINTQRFGDSNWYDENGIPVQDWLDDKGSPV